VLDGDGCCFDSCMRYQVEQSIGEIFGMQMKSTDVNERQHRLNGTEPFAKVVGVMCFLVTSTERRHVGVWEWVDTLYLSSRA
jgi:hypothetical protein